MNPAKEEKDSIGRTEEFRLPDGNVVQVFCFLVAIRRVAHGNDISTLARSGAFSCPRDFV